MRRESGRKLGKAGRVEPGTHRPTLVRVVSHDGADIFGEHGLRGVSHLAELIAAIEGLRDLLANPVEPVGDLHGLVTGVGERAIVAIVQPEQMVQLVRERFCAAREVSGVSPGSYRRRSLRTRRAPSAA